MRYILAVVLLVTTMFAQSAVADIERLPDAPNTKHFFLLSSVDLAATFADAQTSHIAQSNGCYEIDSFMYGSKHPTDARFYTTMFTITAGEQLVSYFMWRKGKRLWWLPMTANSSIHTIGTIQNWKNGCFHK